MIKSTKFLLMLAVLLTIALPTLSQTNSSDSIKISKDQARKAIIANRENAVLRVQVEIMKQEIDTCRLIVEQQDFAISDYKNALETQRELRRVESEQLRVCILDNNEAYKKARKYKRQRNGITIGAVLSIVGIIILI